mmetsp:Transcript_45903/g.103403  ORF Transcript_45903/g.103403 Transcript_45903/m.103403 type:complete len:178 (-) Transcript_45903:897-1430(-)
MSALPMDNPDETDAVGSEVDADRVPLRALKPNEKTCTWNASQGKEGASSNQKEEQGVTSEVSDASFCPPRQMSPSDLQPRFLKKFRCAADGLQCSGEDLLVKDLNLQDCRDIRDAVTASKVTTNPIVIACCGNFDEQEGRGFLAANILGVVLLRGDEVPNEGHKIGLQIDDFLRQAK